MGGLSEKIFLTPGAKRGEVEAELLGELERRGSAEDATAIVRLHLSRLDDTIADSHLTHAESLEESGARISRPARSS